MTAYTLDVSGFVLWPNPECPRGTSSIHFQANPDVTMLLNHHSERGDSRSLPFGPATEYVVIGINIEGANIDEVWAPQVQPLQTCREALAALQKVVHELALVEDRERTNRGRVVNEPTQSEAADVLLDIAALVRCHLEEDDLGIGTIIAARQAAELIGGLTAMLVDAWGEDVETKLSRTTSGALRLREAGS